MKIPKDEGGLVLVVARVSDRREGKSYLVSVTDVTYSDAKRKFPGGRIKVGESPLAAGARELKEETRLDATHASRAPRIIGMTHAYGRQAGVRYAVYFMDVVFSSDYIGQTLTGGFCEGKLVSTLIEIPMTEHVRNGFLTQHREQLRKAHEETFADVFVPT